jgi:predicted nuclease of restriction endonuclease-like (RecB) superfamily
MAGEGRRRDRRANGDAAGDAPLPAPLPADYATFLAHLKEQIRGAQVGAALAANRELILLYWRIGEAIVAQQERAAWGDAVLDRLSTDLRRAFPGVGGLSRRNLYRMRALYRAYRERPDFVPRVVAQLPWGHNIILLEKLPDPVLREWYARAAIAHGWSRAILEAQIETRLDLRQGRATTNFARALPAPQSELAQQALKDPYTFDFLTLGPDARERDLERGLLAHLRAFMLELGVGFAFLGSQYHLEVGGEDFYLDLLFYHVRLRCYVVIDLKLTAFRPEYAGKLTFYLSAVDDLLRHPDDGPTIGILLCRGQNRVRVEYALRDIAKPLGGAGFTLAPALPARLAASLPTPEQIAAELDGTAASAPEEQGDDT